MNKTIFTFGIAPVPQGQLATLEERLANTTGVVSVASKNATDGIEIFVTAEFDNSNVAKATHRKLMAVFTKSREIRLTYSRSHLSDIFS